MPEEDATENDLISDADSADEKASEDNIDSGEAKSAEDGREPSIGEAAPAEARDPVAGDAFARTADE